MIWMMLGLLLATMLVGIPILLCIALVGFVGMAAEPGIGCCARMPLVSVIEPPDRMCAAPRRTTLTCPMSLS